MKKFETMRVSAKNVMSTSFHDFTSFRPGLNVKNGFWPLNAPNPFLGMHHNLNHENNAVDACLLF